METKGKKGFCSRSVNVKTLVIIAIAAVLLCVAAVVAVHIITDYQVRIADAKSAEVEDEITRAKHFVSDWYQEISGNENGVCSVYLNELRFGKNEYTLTYAGNRLRAVYPRGERFFKLENIRKVEFFSVDEKVRCRFYYGETGEYTFSV